MYGQRLEARLVKLLCNSEQIYESPLQMGTVSPALTQLPGKPMAAKTTGCSAQRIPCVHHQESAECTWGWAMPR